MAKLEFVDEIYIREPDYDFDIVRVVKDSKGNHYWGRDSGCSCPTPFEDFRSTKDWRPLVSEYDMRIFLSHVSDSYVSVAEQNDFMTTVLNSIRLSGNSILQ